MTIHNPRALQHAEVPNPSVAFCHGKPGFDSPKLAWEVARSRKSRGPRTVYRCSRCGLFHVAGRQP